MSFRRFSHCLAVRDVHRTKTTVSPNRRRTLVSAVDARVFEHTLCKFHSTKSSACTRASAYSISVARAYPSASSTVCCSIKLLARRGGGGGSCLRRQVRDSCGPTGPRFIAITIPLLSSRRVASRSIDADRSAVRLRPSDYPDLRGSRWL